MVIQEITQQIFEMMRNQAAYSRIMLDYMHIFFDKLFFIFLYIAASVSLLYVVLSVIALFSKDEKYKEKKFIPSKAPMVTIQIPTRNEIIALRCVRKCLEFDYPKDHSLGIAALDLGDEMLQPFPDR